MKLCSESALIQSLDYLCSSLYQSDITIFNFFFARQMKDEIMAVNPRAWAAIFITIHNIDRTCARSDCFIRV